MAAKALHSGRTRATVARLPVGRQWLDLAAGVGFNPCRRSKAATQWERQRGRMVPKSAIAANHGSET